jgi:non-canonical (house-cleaning) NTP pyrophosphatase
MKAAAKTLETLGYEIILPSPQEGEIDYNSLPDAARATLKETLIQDHLNEINESDAVLIFNEDKKGIAGYIGGNTLMEMAFAYAQKIELFLFKPVPDMSYIDEILGMKPIVLDGDINKIDTYFKQLPTVLVSSKSPLKLSAISRGMRRAGIRTRVIARPTESNVSEQPMTTEEIHQGALNRHEALVRVSASGSDKPDYFATVESGQNRMHPDHNTFGGSVIIIEKRDGERKIGISINIEYPKAMTDKVPSQYPDLGVLVQREYGSKFKDPVPFLTNGKINRRQLVEEAVRNVAAQLSEV